MERKRKMPARAAARSEQVAAKKRNVTPRERSATPTAPAAAVVQPPEDPPPPPLPKSIQAGKPLPTVEDAQAEDLSVKEYQTVGESGVLAESLNRSRHKWISEGLFEKYWTKPFKRKGVTIEDPNNPPKESMTKVGPVTITIEPHVVEATMYVVKESKPRPSQQPANRPIIQYGPPNGTMPPPASTIPSQPAATPEPKRAAPSPASNTAQPSPRPQAQQAQPAPQAGNVPKPSAPPPAKNTASSPSPGLGTRPSIAAGTLSPTATPPPAVRAPSNPLPAHGKPPTPASTASQARPATLAAPAPLAPLAASATTGTTAAPPRPPVHTNTTPIASSAKPATSHSTPATPAKGIPNDPVIALLAQKASDDVELRELMKKVAVGHASGDEVVNFQRVIDRLNEEYRNRPPQQGPPAEKLYVDGRTVKYFADEVRTILDIVLASNPHQRSSELRPPPGSDPLVVLLVRTALEDTRTRDVIRRIADGRPTYKDATDLKETLDRLHRDMKTVPLGLPTGTQAKQPATNSVVNGRARPPQPTAQSNQQALRSKGPPPVPKSDVTAVVFDFGTGDRYLFPKFSILEYLPTSSGQQVVASFLIVRKGSTSEYGGDPKLDYYQPATIRLYTHTGRQLENLARVVAPQDEVRRYMDDVMDNMTRAEYVLLAMRLPRGSKDGDKESGGPEETKTNGSTPNGDGAPEQNAVLKPGVLWATKSKSGTPSSDRISSKPGRDLEGEGEAKYQRLIQSVAAKDT